MKEITIKLESIDDVKNFVSEASRFKTDIDLVSGRYIIDAKSILGIFSLDLGKPVTVQIADDEEAPEVIEAFGPYIIAN